MTNIRGIKEVIQNTRKEKGYTQREMANKLNISQPAYSYYEKGNKPLPAAQLKKVLEILELDPEDIHMKDHNSLSALNESLTRIGDLLEKILEKM
ncbi:MAG: helix-turn-helix transcriptional regulator [Clostridia bacterium]|nr:helix-turn-helix transcriptional regulator [Clostridia bacterium]